MLTLITFIAALLTNIGVLASPIDTAPPTEGERKCPHLLTLDEKLIQAQTQAGTDNNQQIRSLTTQLLKENFKPLIEDIRNAAIALSDEDLADYLKIIRIYQDKITKNVDANALHVGLNAGYEFRVNYRFTSPIEGRIPYDSPWIGVTSENSQMMYAATITHAILLDLLNKMKRSFASQQHESNTNTYLLEKSTYYANAWETFRDSLPSYMFTLSQLTSSKIPGFTDSELVEQLLTKPAHSRMSLMSLVAILYGPAIIGPHGGISYFENPLAIDENGKLTLSPEYKAFLKNTKPIPADRTLEATGNGCPVAHCATGELSGIDILNEGFLSIYRRVSQILEASEPIQYLNVPRRRVNIKN